MPLVDTRDVGVALAVILASAGCHAGATYALTGSAAFGYDEVAQALSLIVRRPVTYEPLAPEQYRRELLAAGVPEWRATDLAFIASSYAPAEWAVTTDLDVLLGHRPRSLHGFLHDHMSDFSGNPAA